ncbi:SDR family oxidoreductase [uncultured Litoreibacter sp.]|uniref:SDR family oxidoreductase n=1 Tax=uncultured Litoreibacter sp. TaxID=1392394 RepID=UPI00261E63AC|nr:SDR family oxidoreductase [uncultured Litoreibacter sp.]
MGKLDGKTALITGGTTGIGFATAEAFLREGARLAITGQNQDRLASAGEKLGAEVLTLQTDQSALSQIDAMVSRINDQFGQLDTVFLNAGVTVPAPIEAVTEEQFDYLYQTNLKGPFFTLQKLIPVLSEGATIVINASNLASMGVPTTSAYAATKAALISLTRTFAAELLPKGIRVNAVAPGPIETPSMGKLGMSEEQLQGLMEQLTSTIPMGRIGQAEEIAKAVLFLASDGASFMTGETITLDGGWSSL